jgi:hypothetical protein
MSFLFVLYGCLNWSLTLGEEYTLRVMESMVLRRVFVPEREDVTGSLGKPDSEELRSTYSSRYKVKEDKSGGTCSTLGREQKCMQNFGGQTCSKETPWKT